MKTIFNANRAFIIPYIIFILLGAVLIIINSKSITHLEFNTLHNSFFDVFFYYATNLGDGVMALLIVIILIVIKYKYALIVALSTIIASLITQLLKHTFFSGIVRPKKFFEGVHELYFVPGVNNHLYNSFPSGHSTCAFSLYFSLALLVKNKLLKFIFFSVALLSAYSRIYLSQHFFEDVYVGSLIGTIIAFVVFYAISTKANIKLEESLITQLKKQ
ncbi:MAG: phosphatase PAP2 family protein [Bacteroidia bacterium]